VENKETQRKVINLRKNWSLLACYFYLMPDILWMWSWCHSYSH